MIELIDEAEAVAAAEREVFRAEFLRIAGDPDSLPLPLPAGRVVRDYRINASRHQTGSEIIADAMDDANELPLAMGLICRAALGQDITDDARRMLERCATVWADRRADV